MDLWDRTLSGFLILGAAFLPWGIEVVVQLRLQAWFLAALPESARAALPAHPRRPALAFLAPWRFHLALWRAFRHDLPGEAPAVSALKRRMRASLRREFVWIAIALTTLVALFVRGWRPL